MKHTVTLVTSSVSRRGGGVSDAIRNLARSLRNKDTYSIQVFGLRDPDTAADLSAWGHVPVRTFGVAGPGAFGFSPGLGGALEAAQTKLVHVHGLWMYLSVASLSWARQSNPYIVSPHGMLDPWAVKNSHWKKRLAGALYENRHLRGAACLHALNGAEVDAIREYGLRSPICVIPNGVDIPEERAAVPAPWDGKFHNDARVLFYIGRLHPKKGLDRLLRGWSMVQRYANRSSWHLVIAGWNQGGHELELRSLASELGLSDSVHFIGPQFGEFKAACLQAADAFVLPSLSEGLPMTVLEAWANGLPVLMTGHCNLPNGFEAGAALRIESEAESIATQLRVLFQMSDEDRKAIGRRGLDLVKENHRWPSMAAKMCEVYQWALGEGAAPDCLLK